MNKKYRFLIVIFLIVASLIAYGRILDNNFVNIDDDRYITENNHIKSGIDQKSIKWAFSTTYAEFWHPLTWLSLMFDYQLHGLNPGGYHLTNLILHIMSALLLFWLFSRMTGAVWKSAFVAALFALHPLNAESVAWIAERKDVLSAFFWMLTLCLYVHYTEKPIISRYLLVLFSFVCGLMSKSMVVTLPIVMILLDYWPLGRLRSKDQKLSETRIAGIIPLWQLREKIPFFIFSAVFSIITLYAQYNPSVKYFTFPLTARIANAPVSSVTYLGKIFWPHDLAVFYPFSEQLPVWQVLSATLLIILISLAVVVTVKRLPYLFVGWMWYAITLLPVIGIVQAGKNVMADRYTYLPSIGIAVMVAWGIPLLFPREDIRKKILYLAGMAALTILAVLTWQQCGYWKNSIELFNHTLQVTKNNDLAHSNLASALLEEGKIDQAVFHYRAALQIKPNDYIFHYNLAKALSEQAKIEEAIVHYRETLRINPNFIGAHNNLAVILYSQNKYDESIYHLRQALNIKPDDPSYHFNIGFVLSKKGELKEAIEHFRQAIYLKPDYEKARQELRLALEKEQQQKH